MATSGTRRPQRASGYTLIEIMFVVAIIAMLAATRSELEAAQQAEAADKLVQALRERGVREIMVYDDDRQLRIQALGNQPARVIPARVVR